MNSIIPEQRSYSDTDNFYKRTLSNGVVEHYSKEFFNSDFTRKLVDDNFEDLKKDILLLLINDILS
jgi:hypothetical protein